MANIILYDGPDDSKMEIGKDGMQDGKNHDMKGKDMIERILCVIKDDYITERKGEVYNSRNDCKTEQMIQ